MSIQSELARESMKKELLRIIREANNEHWEHKRVYEDAYKDGFENGVEMALKIIRGYPVG